MNYINLSAFVSSVNRFNTLIGRKKTIKESVDRQMPILDEEIQELKEAIAANDEVEILDAIIDIVFVASEFLFIAENLGYDVDKALKNVAASNNSKFINVKDYNRDALQRLILESIENIHETKGVTAHPIMNSDLGLVMLVDENGKLRKPLCFVEPTLAEYVPKK